MGWDYDGYIATIKVDLNGQITILKQYEHDKYYAKYNSLVRVDENTVALSYQSSSAGYVKTFTIATDGSTITQVKSTNLTGTDNNSKYYSFIHLNGTTYVVAYTGKSADGYISTLDISLDGATVDVKKTIEHEGTQSSYNSLLQIRPNTVMLAYAGIGTDGFIKTFTIPDGGGDITPVISLEHNQQNALFNNLSQIDSDTYLLTYVQENNKLYYRTFTSKWLDSEVSPEISTVKLKADNSEIEVTFNEPVYTATGASTALVKEDFKFSLSGGTAKLASSTPSSFAKSSNTYTLGISLTGTPNGLEKLTVAPADANAIYDANDNKASVKKDLRNSANLFDKTPPTIVSTTNNQNEYIDVFFSEPVFSAGNAYSTLDKNDFKLELTGGTATLSTTTPKGIMGYADRGENSKKGYKFRLEIKGLFLKKL